MGAAPRPFVSIVVPTRNEARSARACLESVLAQDYPAERMEVLVLDGRSTDATREIVADIAASSGVPIRLLENPGRSVPAALNIALREAAGEFLIRVDGHSEPEPSYVSRCVAGNLELGADLAGGWVEAIGHNLFGRAVAAAFTSPVAMGHAVSWRRPDAPREVVSVPCGSYRIETLRRIGGFDEGQKANQDYEVNYRLRLAGGKAVLLPEVRFRYVARSTVRSLARQFFRYGFYKARVMVKHPASVRPRHLAPGLAVLLGAALAVLSFFHEAPRWVLAGGALLYVSALVAASVRTGRGRGSAAFLLPAVFATMHATWVAGNLAGIVRWLPAYRSVRAIANPIRGRS